MGSDRGLGLSLVAIVLIGRCTSGSFNTTHAPPIHGASLPVNPNTTPPNLTTLHLHDTAADQF